MIDRPGPVLVTGATGQQGGAAARALLAAGWRVRALVRDAGRAAAQELRAAGAELVVGDLDDPASVRAALSGAYGVFLVLTPLAGAAVADGGVLTEERRGRLVVDLAAESGVGHLVYSSVAGAEQDAGVAHIRSKGHIEAHLRAAGVPATVLRPVFFMENFTTYARPAVLDGELVVSLALRPDTPLQLVATRDIGAFAALAFTHRDRYLGRCLVLAGDRLTGVAIAERFGVAAGLPARFSQVPLDRLRAVDAEVARMFEWFDTGQTERADIPALRAQHPDLMSLTGWLARSTAWQRQGTPR